MSGKLVTGAGCALVTLVVGCAIAWLVWYRADFHSFPWATEPASLTYCGRDYQNPTRETRRQFGSPARLYPVQVGPPIFSVGVLSPRKPSHASFGCGVGLLVIHDGAGRFWTYGGVGGP